jgi:hypothetical protein
MEITMSALDQAYRQEAVCRPRIDIQIPTKDSKQDLSVGHDRRGLHFGLLRDSTAA